MSLSVNTNIHTQSEQTIREFRHEVSALEWSPGGDILAIASYNLSLWKDKMHGNPARLRIRGSRVRTISWSPTGICMAMDRNDVTYISTTCY